MMKHVLFGLVFFTILFIIHIKAVSQIQINEVCASNSSIVADPDYNEYADWIELRNTSASNQNLKGWYLTDNFNSPTKWQITTDLVIPANGYLLFWADGKNSGAHTSFKLSAEGEEIALFNAGVTLVDSVSFANQRADVSFGRNPANASVLGYFSMPTPGLQNNGSFYTGFTSNVPEFNVRGGFFTSAISVAVFTDMGGTIRYTIDGSEPLETSSVYQAPISINKTTIVRARIFKPGELAGPIVTQSYFFNDEARNNGLPVVSIASNPENFWDPAKGIYVQDFKPLWEIPVNVELFEPADRTRSAFNEPAGAKINGLWSWQLPQKMLGIYFDKQYGNSQLDYPITRQRKRSSYKNFALRASGSDWSYTMFRDILGHHTTLLNMDVDIMGFRPSVVYFNGQYMGIHNIREKVDDDYIEKSYGLESGSFDMVENEDYAEAGSLDEYNTFLTVLEADLTQPANYTALENIMDIDNFTDYVITEMAVANTSIDHNVMAWKPKQNGRWRWILMDVDRGFFNPTDHLIDFYLSKEEWPFKELFTNEQYVQKFAKRLSLQLYTSFNPQQMNQLIEGHHNDIENEIPNHVERWLGTTSSYGNAMPSVEYWEKEVNDVKLFCELRPFQLLTDLKNYGFNGIGNLTLTTFPDNGGQSFIDSLLVPESNWTGPFLANSNIALSVKPLAGYKFVGWSVTPPAIIISKKAEWKYLDNGTFPGADWTKTSFDDATWKSGLAELGYGDGDENTIVNQGNTTNRYITTWFRKTISLTKQQATESQFLLNILKDDGAVVYINGLEAARFNMPGGAISSQTGANSSLSAEAEAYFESRLIASNLFIEGQNTIAVEVHQRNGSSADVSFDLELLAINHSNPTITSAQSILNHQFIADACITAVFESTGQCIVPNEITQNVTLNKACSPYIAQGDISIAQNATLTIEPGVEVWMPEGASILVNGALNAQGTALEPILIKPNSELGTSSWGVISFKHTPVASTLKYVTIEGASQGVDPITESGAISAFDADLNLENLTLLKNYGNPITARYSSVNLSNSQLHSDITGDLINVKYGQAYTRNCVFVGSEMVDTDAIDYDEVENGIISNCTISQFKGPNCDAIDIGEMATNIQIDSLFVFNVADKGVSVGQRSSAIIQNSIFVNCTMGVASKDSSRVLINQSTFYNNGTSVACYEKNPGNAGGNTLVTNSILSNSALDPYYCDNKSTLKITYSLSDTKVLPTGTGNSHGNPEFFNPNQLNFGLQTSSPALLSGNQNGQAVNMGFNEEIKNLDPTVFIKEFFFDAMNEGLPEFITIYNPASTTADLSGYTITKGITVSIPEGTFLEAHDWLYLVNGPTWWFPFLQNKQVIHWSEGKLSDNGEAIQLEDGHGIVMDHFIYDNDGLWPADAFTENWVLKLKRDELDNHFGYNWTTVPVTDVLSAPSHEASVQLNVYPNPANNLVTISTNQTVPQKVIIYSIAGVKLAEYQISSNVPSQFDVSSYSGQIIVIRCGSAVQKLVVL